MLIKELPGYALFEPLPLRAAPRPPVLPETVDPQRQDGTVYIADLYAGPGLKGIPRGTVTSLRVFTYHFAYQGMVGNPGTIGIDGPWDIKRVLGTVPVQADGSAKFTIPANTPISVQPLDAAGQALQRMRSWMTAMPGETLQCSGCHEPQNTAPVNQPTPGDHSELLGSWQSGVPAGSLCRSAARVSTATVVPRHFDPYPRNILPALFRAGQPIWEKSANRVPPISGSESPPGSLPIYLPITEKHTMEDTRWNGRRRIACRR